MVDENKPQNKPQNKPMELAIKVLVAGSLTLCIKSVEFERDPVKKLDKVKSKGKYLDLPYGQTLHISQANVRSYGFDTVLEMMMFLREQLPKTAEGRKAGPAFMYSVKLGPQTVAPEHMDLPALKAEIEARTKCKPAEGLGRENAIVALRGLREVCGERAPVTETAPRVQTKEELQKKERNLMEDMFARFNNTATVGVDSK